MTLLPDSIKLIFFRVMQGELSIAEFEQWVYANQELEELLAEQEYMALLSFNYKQPGAKYELFKLLSEIVSLGEYETYKLKLLLEKAKHRNIRLPQVLEQFYTLYCHGYGFLQGVALTYGLEMTYLSDYWGKHWSKLNPTQLDELVSGFSLRLEAEISQIEHWLESGKVVLTGEQDELGHYDYEDHRTLTERNTFTATPIYTPKPKKQWWKWN